MKQFRFLRPAAVIAMATVLAILNPGAASAHVLKGQYANNWATAITSVSPSVPGLTATVTTDGQSVTVTYVGSQIVTIDGYFNEPYLRITPTGLEQNTNSPSVELNQSQNIGSLGDGSGLNKAPAWKVVSSQRVATWHDHRVHWMDNNPPPVAQKDPGHNHLVKTWTINMSVGSTKATINGTLTWLKWTAPSKTPAIIALVIILAVIGAVVLLIRRYRGRREPLSTDPSALSTPAVRLGGDG